MSRQIPPSWAMAKLGDLITLNPKNDAPAEIQAAFMPMAQLGTDYRSRPRFDVRPWAEIARPYVHFGEGDVLLAKITPCFENGKAGIARGLPNGIGAGSSEFFVCRPRTDALIASWLLAWFKTPDFLASGAMEMTGSVGHKRVPKDFVLGSSIPLPPLAEQQRIADKLDAILARADTCRDRLDQVGPLLHRFRRSVYSSAIQGNLTSEWRSANAQEDDRQTLRLGEEAVELPAGWRIAALRDLIRPDRPLCYGVVQPGVEDADGIPLIRVQDLDGLGVDKSSLRTVSPEVDRQYSRSRIASGDVLISVVGTIGRVAMVPEGLQGNIARAIARVSCTAAVSPEWLTAWVRSPAVQWWLFNSSREVARKTLNLSELADLPVAIPPRPEQEEAARRVAALIRHADTMQRRAESALDDVRRLVPGLLDRAFRGELVPQDPADQPAQALLDRLKTQGSAGAPPPRRGRRASA